MVIHMIKAVIFDLDDTLYAYEPLDQEAGKRVQNYACQYLNILENTYKEAYQFGRTETKKHLGNVGASHNRLLYFQKTLEFLKVNPIPMSLQMYEIYWGTFLDNMQLYPGVRELINKLHEKGIVIAVCTDLTAHIQHRKIKALGLCEDISYLITSEEAGKEKPAPEIFELCLRKLGLSPKEVFYIGDNYKKDIEGARACGMQALWFHPDQPAKPQYEDMAGTILSAAGA